MEQQQPQSQDPDEVSQQGNSEPESLLNLTVQDQAGNTYGAQTLSSTRVRDFAADFFNECNWSARDQSGRPQRTVVERQDPDDPDRSTRLRPEQTLHQAGVRDGDTLRVFPEAIAGLVNPDRRLGALIVDYRDVCALAEADDQITFEANSDYNPTHYDITFRHTGVMLDGNREVVRTNNHRCTIDMPAGYPMEAPIVIWRTPIFHPNIHPSTGTVCLGVLQQRYTPGVGLGYIVCMLRDIVQYRNYDLHSALNGEAAKWAASEAGQEFIRSEEIGGFPKEEPLEIVLKALQDAARTRTHFEPYNPFLEDGA